jgi:nitroreductase
VMRALRTRAVGMLPNGIRVRLRASREAAAALVAKVFSSTALSASIYFVFDGAFRREHRAALAGKWAYHKGRRTETGSSPLLRRNVHRIEKGLVSRPRRNMFATQYIEETVRVFESRLMALGEALPRVGELRWAHDVLEGYFAAVEAGHPAIDRARARYFAAISACRVIPRSKPIAPYARDLSMEPAVTYDDFLSLSFRRRSVRWYEARPVPRDLLDRAILAARLAPSACNRQPFRFLIYDDPLLLRQVAAMPGGTRGFAHNFPVVVVVLGNLDAFVSERDRHLIYIDGSLAAMAFMYALETLGLSSCPINWPDVPEPESAIRHLVGLTASERVVMLIAVGYPDPSGLVPASEKLTLEEVRVYNRWRGAFSGLAAG